MSELRHETRSSIEPSDGGYFWRCDGCGWLGFGLPSAADAAAEARRHVAEFGPGGADPKETRE